jgi:peptidyl-prolyl cis-trans isomerase-like 2
MCAYLFSLSLWQGGDPTGTGGGGESAFMKPFKDEHDSRLNHDKRGVLSMANSGENTNGSQFFICFQPTPHLDLKHSIFGRVVGGLAVLDRIESIESNKQEVPLTDIVITGVQVIQNPIPEADERLKETILREQALKMTNAVKSGVPAGLSQRPLAIGPAAGPSVSSVGGPISDGSNRKRAASGPASEPSRVGKYMLADASTGRSSSSASASSEAVESFLRSQGAMASEDDLERNKKKSRPSSSAGGAFGSW